MPVSALPRGLAMLFMGSHVSRGVRRAAERRLEAEERKNARLIRRQELRESRAFRARESERGRKFGGQMEEARRGWAMEQEARGLEARRTEAETQFGRQRQLAGEEWGAQERGREFERIRGEPEREMRHRVGEAQIGLAQARTGAVGQPRPGPEADTDRWNRTMQVLKLMAGMRGKAQPQSELAQMFMQQGIPLPEGMAAQGAGGGQEMDLMPILMQLLQQLGIKPAAGGGGQGAPVQVGQLTGGF